MSLVSSYCTLFLWTQVWKISCSDEERREEKRASTCIPEEKSCWLYDTGMWWERPECLCKTGKVFSVKWVGEEAPEIRDNMEKDSATYRSGEEFPRCRMLEAKPNESNHSKSK